MGLRIDQTGNGNRFMIRVHNRVQPRERINTRRVEGKRGRGVRVLRIRGVMGSLRRWRSIGGGRLGERDEWGISLQRLRPIAVFHG